MQVKAKALLQSLFHRFHELHSNDFTAWIFDQIIYTTNMSSLWQWWKVYMICLYQLHLETWSKDIPFTRKNPQCSALYEFMHQTLATALKIEDSSCGTYSTNAAIHLTPFPCESAINFKTEYYYSFCSLSECFVFSCEILFNTPSL